MKALVTGGVGFIGRPVCQAFADAGHQVTCWDQAVGTDVRHMARVDPSSFDVVVHAAARVGGRKVIDWTPIDHAVNLAIDAELFTWAARIRPGRVIYFSSSCAYPSYLGAAGRPLAEDDIDLGDPQWPDGLYGWAKLTGELLAATVADAGVPVTVVRPFSVYGPGMCDGFAVTGFAAQARQRADPLVIWGDAGQTRDYIHVTDVAAAVLAIAEQGVEGTVNLGTGIGTPLAELARMVAAAAGYAPEVKVDEGMPAGYRSLVADASRLNGFCPPRVTVEDGITALMKGTP